MKIRHAVSADLAHIAQIEKASYPPEIGDKETDIKSRLGACPECFWVLENEGKIAAFINGIYTDEKDLRDEMYEDSGIHDPDGGWLVILSVATAPEARGMGYASGLMERVIEDSKESGKEGIVLACLEDLVPFYEMFGYIDEGLSGSTHGGATWHQMRLVF